MSKILIKSAWGSDDPTKPAFAFLHGNALAEAGHEVQIFLLGASRGDVTSNICTGHTYTCVRCLCKGPWGPGIGPRRKTCHVCEPFDPGAAD